MVSEKELYKFDEEMFICISNIKMNQEKDNNQLLIDAAIKNTEMLGFELVDNYVLYGQNSDLAYKEYDIIVIFTKNDVEYYIQCRNPKNYIILDENKYLEYLHKLFFDKKINIYQLNLFKKAYYYILKINLDGNPIAPVFDDNLELNFLNKNFFWTMKDEIDFSKENLQILDSLTKQDFEMHKEGVLDIYQNVTAFCGLYCFSRYSYFDIFTFIEGRRENIDILEDDISRMICNLKKIEEIYY